MKSLIYYIKQIADLLVFSLSMTFKLLDSAICLFVTFCGRGPGGNGDIGSRPISLISVLSQPPPISIYVQWHESPQKWIAWDGPQKYTD